MISALIRGFNGLVDGLVDVTTWVMRTNPFGTNLVNNIIYTNNLYIASGSGGKIVTSPDTITWTLQTNPFSTTDNIREIAYGNGWWMEDCNFGKWYKLDNNKSTNEYSIWYCLW